MTFSSLMVFSSVYIHIILKKQRQPFFEFAKKLKELKDFEDFNKESNSSNKKSRAEFARLF
jgi:hypothetical protein